MKKERPSALFNPPKNAEEVGYESATGYYELDGKTITMYFDIVEHSQNIGYPDYREYRLEGRKLTLIRKWHPNRHNGDSEGQTVTLLQRVK